jgi:hypothetical protein
VNGNCSGGSSARRSSRPRRLSSAANGQSLVAAHHPPRRLGSPRPRCLRLWELQPRQLRQLRLRLWELQPRQLRQLRQLRLRLWELQPQQHPRRWPHEPFCAGATLLLGRRHPCSERCPHAVVRPSRGPCRRQCTKRRCGAPRRASQACGASPVSRRREISTWRARSGSRCSMRASPQQQRLGPLPSFSPFPPNCNPQRCDICPGTTSEGDFHGWSKDQAHNARTTHGTT